MILLILLLIIPIVFHIATYSTYGYMLTDDSILYEKVCKNMHHLSLNYYNNSILHFGDLVITTHPINPICKWCVQEGYFECRIPRWSKTHRLIKKSLEEYHKND